MHYIFGYHTIVALLESHPQKVTCLYLQTGKEVAKLQQYIDKQHFEVVRKSKEELDKLAQSTNHQGIVAAIVAISSALHTENNFEQLLDSITTVPLLLILDGVQDPHNLGACLRTANAAGVHAVIAPKDNSVGLTPVVHKVASGAVENTPFIQVTNLARTMRMLKERGIWIFGADDKAQESIFAMDFKLPMAFVLGAEGSGMRRLTKDNCDYWLHIPMCGSVPNLNVSVATGVCLFEVIRQRGEKTC